MRNWFAASWLIMAALCADDRDPALIQLGAGVFEIIHQKPLTGMVQVDYRSDYKIYKNKVIFIRPMCGFWINFESGFYTYAGLAFDIFLWDSNWIFTPSIGPGAYLRGNGKNLGFPLEFRDSIELYYRLPNKGRIGAQFYHMSNASLGSKNPGTECLLFFYGIPL